MAIERLKSGRYRIRFEKDKKKHSITTDKKPNKREEAFLIQQYLDSLNRKRKKGTFQEYAIEYIESKENVLSTSTIKGYRNALKAIPISFLSIQLFSIEQHDITKLINSMVSEFKPKTIHNRHGFISAVIKEFRPDFILTTKLPRKEQKDIYTPSETEVMQIFKYLKESPRLSRHYIPVYLGAMGLRRSEIGALCLSDLSDDKLYLHHQSKGLKQQKRMDHSELHKDGKKQQKNPHTERLSG